MREGCRSRARREREARLLCSCPPRRARSQADASGHQIVIYLSHRVDGIVLQPKDWRMPGDGMSDHIVKSFTEQLEMLANAVAQMGGLAEAQFANAIEAIAKRDSKLAESAIGSDERIDRIQQT